MINQFRLIAAAVAMASLWGCTSQPTKDEGKAGVEDRSPTAVTATPSATPITSPQQPSTVTVQPLGSGDAAGAHANAPALANANANGSPGGHIGCTVFLAK